MKITIRKITEIKVFFSNLIKLPMKFGSLEYYVFSMALFVPTPALRVNKKALNEIGQL
jgi:hypothetical protein